MSSRKPSAPAHDLGRRERQIVDVVYRLGRASVADVRAQLPDPPSYSAVRGMLNLLEEKGHLRHVQDGLRYIYVPVVKPE
jgi:predicted transcriptional regulator